MCVVWVDDRHGAKDVWARCSRDAGGSWGEETRLSNATDGAPYKGTEGFGQFYGHYGGIAIAASGRLHAAWPEGPRGKGAGTVWVSFLDLARAHGIERIRAKEIHEESSSVRRCGILSLASLIGACAAVAQPAALREALPVEVAADARGHNGRSPIALSPDGQWVAYTVETTKRFLARPISTRRPGSRSPKATRAWRRPSPT